MNIDKDKALKGLYHSFDARLEPDQLKLKYGPNLTFIEDTTTDTQCFVTLLGHKLIVAFRGTQQHKDWLTDINAFHMQFPYGNLDTKIMVHRGFMGAYLAVRDQIHAYYRSNSEKITNVFVAGHSLGGALGTLCAVDLQYNFSDIKKLECYVSGNPMVGNPAFCRSYDKRVPDTTRTVMRRDIVPKLPPEWFERHTYEGYAHCGKELKIGPRSWLYGLKIAFLKLFRKKERLLDDIFNHDIDMYIDNLY